MVGRFERKMRNKAESQMSPCDREIGIFWKKSESFAAVAIARRRPVALFGAVRSGISLGADVWMPGGPEATGERGNRQQKADRFESACPEDGDPCDKFQRFQSPRLAS